MIPSNLDPVNEWNVDCSWQNWPYGGLWQTPLDEGDVPPISDPTAESSAMTNDATPIIPEPTSMFNVGRSMSEVDPP